MTEKIQCPTSRNNNLRENLFDIFGNIYLVEHYAGDLIDASRFYVRQKRAGNKTKTRIGDINKIIQLCDDLLEAVQRNKEWINANSDISTSSVPGVQEIADGDQYNPLAEFRSILSSALENTPPPYRTRASLPQEALMDLADFNL